MNVLIWTLAIFTFLLDQASKFLILRNFRFNTSSPIVENFFHLTLVRNTGCAFGIFKEQTLFFAIISLAAVIAIFIFLGRRSKKHPLRDAGFALILGGALGNLVDRVRLGYVVDFLDFRIWPVFNVADSAITIGTAMVVVSLFFMRNTQ